MFSSVNTKTRYTQENQNVYVEKLFFPMKMQTIKDSLKIPSAVSYLLSLIVDYLSAIRLKTSMAIIKEIINHMKIANTGDHVGIFTGIEPVSVSMPKL